MKKMKETDEVSLHPSKIPYQRPTFTIISISMEYSISSGSTTSVQQGSIKEDWDGSSSEEREVYW